MLAPGAIPKAIQETMHRYHFIALTFLRKSSLTSSQSSAAHGDKDLLLTYSDTDATPSQPPAVAHRVQASMVEHVDAAKVASPPHAPGPGIFLTNDSKKAEHYFFYNNYWNGNGTAGANFDKPNPSVSIEPGQTHFVSLPSSFKGRVQRGMLQPS